MIIRGSNRATVTLVALCFTTVLGISLAGYLAVCSRTMQLSNRTFQAGLSQQLAELGLEEGLRAFNKNDWSGWTTSGTTVTWDTTTYAASNRAVATLTFPATKFGQGATGSVKIRVDNYNASQLGSTWSSTANYRIGDLVGRNGIWYRSVRNGNTNQTPSTVHMTWWVPDPMPWKWRTSASYLQYEMVNEKGIWYRCISTHTSNATTFSTDIANWTTIPTQRVWASSTAYSLHDVVSNTDAAGDVGLYRCTTAHTSSASFSTDASNWSSNVQTVTLNWASGTVYTRGAVVYYTDYSTIYRWYYCRQSGTSNTTPNADTTMWAPIWTDTTYTAASPGDTVVAATQYYAGDYINYGGAWYRCTTAHTYVDWASSSGNWTSDSPYLQLFYFGPGSLSTSSNNIFYYAGSNWYRYMGGYVLALLGNMHLWSSSSIKYNVGDAIYYNSTVRWYRCLVAHTSSGSILPTNTAYWATDPAYSTAWNSSRQYSANDTVRYNGVWYICILSHIGSASTIPTNTTYWIGANTGTTSYQWSNSTAYSAGAYKCYGGVWYKCLSATTANAGHSPNNTTYWSASWAHTFGVTTGAPVVYAEGTVNLTGSPSVVTQLRTTIAPAPLFPNAAAANATTITANSGGTVDSYDSSVGTYASQTSSATTNHSAVLASAYTAGTAITLSSTTVKGYLAAPSSTSSPYAPLYSSGGTVKSYTSPGSPNIDLTRISRSPYIPKFDTIPGGAGGLAANWATTPKGTPLSWTTSPASTILNLGTPGDTTPSRYYYNGTLTIGTATQNILRINGPVILYVNGDLNITASGFNGRIDIANTGSAEIHVAGRFMADAGGEGILSYNTDPKSLIIISDTTGTSTHYYSEGVNPLYGVIYIPYSTSTTGYYNNNNATEVFGAISANQITYSGANLNIHYDTSLRSATFGGVDQPYAITEWRELTDAAERATMP